MSVQPSEIIKMVVVVAMARYLADLHVKGYLTLGQMFKAAVICGIPVGLTLLQPDMGTAVTYMPILLVGLFLRGIRPRIIVATVLLILLVLPMSWYLVQDFLKDHQRDRILTFIDPSRDPEGKGYQVWQSKIAIGGECPTCGQGSISSAAWAYGKLYTAGGRTFVNGEEVGAAVRAHDPSTGRILWEYPTAGSIFGSVVVANNLVVVAADMEVIVLDARNGRKLWSYDTRTM